MADLTRTFPRHADVKGQVETYPERNAWIDKYFPNRKCTDIPGVYDIPGTDLHLQVFLERVNVWSETLEQIEHDENVAAFEAEETLEDE